LSNSLTSGVALGLAEALVAGAVVVVVVAGDIPGTEAVAMAFGTAGEVPVTGVVAGDIAGAVAGDITGAVAGLVAVVGGAPGGLAGDVGGGGWPNEVSARVTEKRAISVVFIG
jgi:hypothetical protein